MRKYGNRYEMRRSIGLAKKRREPDGGNLHTGKWHAWCRNELHAYA
jgi:hypothetical protein